MKKLFLLFLLFSLVMPAYVGWAQDDAVLARLQVYNASLPQGYGVTTVEDFNTLLAEKEFMLLDVRETSEYEAGHIPSSFNIPIRELGQNLALLPDLNANIMVICKGGGRAMLAMTSLNILGYNNARMLKGGYDAWAAAEMPTTTEAFLPESGVAPEIDAPVLEAVNTYLSTLPEGFSLVAPTDVAVELTQNPPLLLDVRKQEELDKDGYIEGSQHIWINELMSHLSELPTDKSTNIVVYCASGFRGGMTTVMLELLGYNNVRNMSGGFGAWKSAGLPVVGGFNLDTYLSDYVVALPDSFNVVTVDELAAELADATELTVVDVRTPDEYAEGHIEGAINIQLTELTQNLALLPNLDENIVVVCGSGHRSALAMTALTLLGYTNVRSLGSGMGAWTKAEQPVTDVPFEVEASTAPTFLPVVFDKVNAFITSIPASYYTVKPVDLGVEMMSNPPVLIDVRSDSEWAEGYIEGAIHIQLRDFMANISQLPQDKTAPIVLYDNPTHRSSMALVFLKMMGYENVRVMGGGINGWTAAGLPLVTE
ncbi:MAG: rhodanese-like domain-containing protein [Chloroflexi bacterium]|nr:rhodanese-like domain-containing protein [Chloroflexota bacterium]